MNSRIYTRDEAMLILPAVEIILDSLADMQKQLTENNDAMAILETLWGDDLATSPDGDEYHSIKQARVGFDITIREQLEELDKKGCHIRSLDLREVAFFHVDQGRVVLLVCDLQNGNGPRLESLAPNALVFTLEEARLALPAVRDMLAILRSNHTALSAVREELDVLNSLSHPGEDELEPTQRRRELMAEAESLTQMAANIQKDLETMGIQVKDYSTGLIDFFHVRDGRIVYLCWRSGEDDLVAWHELEGGFSGRQPL